MLPDLSTVLTPGAERSLPADLAELAFLANAGAMLIASADYESTIALLPQLTVPRSADWCLVDLAGRDGALALVALAHADPAAAPVARALRASVGAPGFQNSVGSVPAAPILVAEVGEDALEHVVADPERARLIRRAGARSFITIPLRARGRALGTMTLLRGPARPPFGAADLAVAEDLAWRAALAIDKAWLHRETEEAVRIRDRVLSIVSHDLASPLHVIEMNAQLLADAPLGGDEEDRRRGLERVQRAALRMKALVRELVDVAALRDGRPLELERSPVELVALTRELVEETRQAAPDQPIELDVSCRELRGSYDRHRVERVIANLLSNAVKYSPGGGLIRVSVTGQAGRWAVIEVADHGVGIAEADLPRVFDLFHRGKHVGQRIQGSGIGLASACQVALRHGGSLTVRSSEGKGSTFTFKLPLERGP